VHLGSSFLPVASSILQYLSVISTVGSFSTTSFAAGGVPTLPRSYSERRIIVESKSSAKFDLKFMLKFEEKIEEGMPKNGAEETN